MPEENVKLTPADAMEAAQRIKKNADVLADAMDDMVRAITTAQENGAVTDAHIKMRNDIEELRAKGLKEAIEAIQLQANNIEIANRRLVEYEKQGAQ